MNPGAFEGGVGLPVLIPGALGGPEGILPGNPEALGAPEGMPLEKSGVPAFSGVFGDELRGGVGVIVHFSRIIQARAGRILELLRRGGIR